MLVRCGPEYACVTAGAPTSAVLQQGREDRAMGPGARAGRAGQGSAVLTAPFSNRSVLFLQLYSSRSPVSPTSP